jgi:hypothetical protein
MTHLHPHHRESFIHALIYRRIYHCILSLAPFLPALIQSIWLGPPERKRSKKTRSPSIHPSIEIPTTISLFPLSFCWHNDAVPLTPVKRNSERHHAEIKSLYAHAGNSRHAWKPKHRYANLLFSLVDALLLYKSRRKVISSISVASWRTISCQFWSPLSDGLLLTLVRIED